MLSKFSVPGQPTNLDNSMARPIALAVGVSGVVWTFFLLSIFFLFFLPLWETARYRLKYCLKGSLNPKQPTRRAVLIKVIQKVVPPHPIM